MTSERNDLPGHGTIVFGGGRFLMLTTHSQAELISSINGATWEKVPVADGAKFNWLVWGGREFFVGDGKAAFQSADGKTWRKADISTRGEVQWSDGQRFISTSWPGKMAYSADGKQWENSPPLTANGINRVLFGGEKPK